MINNRANISVGGILLFLTMSIVFFTACQTENTTLGSDIINQDALLETVFTDTLSIEATIEKRPPIDLLQAQVQGTFLFGKLDDPVFGKSRASIYTQISPGVNNLTFDSLPVLDSIILSIAYPSSSIIYGDNDADQELKVYEIDVLDPVNRQDSYTTATQYDLKGEIGSKTFRFPNDGESTEVLNIRLDNDFGAKLINKSLQPEDSVYFSIARFLEFFNGIALIPSENNSAISFFNLKSASTKLTIYYKAIYQPNPSEEVYKYGGRSKTFDLRDFTVGQTNTLGTSVNFFEHDYAGSPIEPILNNAEPLSDTGYLQGMAGVQMRLKLPTLHNLGNIIVNSAFLEVISPVSEADSIFVPAPSMEIRLDPLDVANNQINNLNYVDYARPAFGVIELDSTTNEEIRKYQMLVPFSIQRLSSEESGNRDIIIRIPENGVNNVTLTSQFLNPFRLIVAGPEHPNYKMRLRLYYTKVD